MNDQDILKCPNCGHLHYNSHYQLHVGRKQYDIEERWTTRRFREDHNLKPDSIQILIVPPIDITWNTCRFCGAEFDEKGQMY
jgi:uncharacterized C2H2 Zn-finger protein